MSDIAAISTPRGAGGISVIRISGENAVKIAGEIFSPVSSSLPPEEMKGYTCAYGKITDGDEVYDEGVLTVFRAPRSYTGEDVAELSCHGGIFVTERILQLIYSKGAVPAGPGEFTKRAFLNGKMGLIEAEAVMDIISAEGKTAQRCAVALKEGALFKEISAVSFSLLRLLGELGAWVDYPEEDIPEVSGEALTSALEDALARLEKILSSYDSGRIIREGIDTAIVGKPNVGKSTLMNLLTGCERSIVTDIAGTTRDIVEESVRLGDIVLRLSDTAGIRGTDDIVESLGVERASGKIDTADLILAVFDNSSELSPEDIEIAGRCAGKNAVGIINKTDKAPRLDTDYIESRFDSTVYISAGTGEGKEELQKVISNIFKTDSIDYNAGVLANERQRDCVKRSAEALREALDAAASGLTLDAVNILIDDAENSLLELTGERASEAVVNEVFSHFCVGK